MDCRVWKIALRWWIRLLWMDDRRYPKICFNELKRMDETYRNDGLAPERYNWATQIRTYLEFLGHGHLWTEENVVILAKCKDLVSLASDISYYSDVQRAENSTYSDLYKKFEVDRSPCLYLQQGLSLEKCKVISQLRLTGNSFFRIISRGEKHQFYPKNKCSICNMQHNDDLFHLLCECVIFSSLRESLLSNFYNRPALANFHRLLTFRNNCEIFRLYNFVRRALGLVSQ